MLELQQYKTFFNSEDFQYLYKKSIRSLQELYVDVTAFYETVVKKAIKEKNIFIFYIDRNPVGYVVFSLNQGKIFWDFDFIINENKYRKYVRVFRTSILSKIKGKVKSKKLEFIILKKNVKSLNSLFKLPKHTKIKLDQKDIHINGQKAILFEMELNQLDKFDLCDSLKKYETRSCLHFGTFAREITGAQIQNDDASSVQQERKK